MLVGNISQDNLISAPACSVWNIYRGFNIVPFVNQYLSHVIGTFDLIKGDGGPGSVVRLTYPPGTPGVGYEIDRFTITNDEKRVKEFEQVEGGYLALGFSCFIIRYEILEESPRSCIARSTFEYEIPEKLAENVSLLSFEPQNIVVEAVEKHLATHKAYDHHI